MPAQPAPHLISSPEDLDRFHRAVSGSLEVRSPTDLLIWLQGEMQHYMPHDVLIVAWGDFGKGQLHHDVVSVIPGLCSFNADAKDVNSLMARLHGKWVVNGMHTTSLDDADSSLLFYGSDQKSVLGTALETMRSALVHGMVDRRSLQDCLYVTLSSKATAANTSLGNMSRVFPYLDMASRLAAHAMQPLQQPEEVGQQTQAHVVREFGMSERELEVLQWVAAGKTNPEIGSILYLSEFTIKNHLKRIFVKLNVMNRAQAVSRFQTLAPHA